MNKRWEIILAGSGGQGLGLAGQIFAEAAILATDCFAAHNQSFGGQARGGASQSSLILSCDEIVYPLVTEADLLLALTPKAYKEYEPQVSASGIVVYDSSAGRMELKSRVKEYGYPFQEETLKIGNSKGVTLMAIGAANELLQIVDKKYFMEAMARHFQGQVLDLNKAAFARGQKLAAKQLD